MADNKAGIFRFYWVAFATGFFTLLTSLRIICGSFIAKNPRSFVSAEMLTWSKRLLELGEVTIEVSGSEYFPACGQPVIVMCNHSSLYDIPISTIALNTDLRMLAKKEIFKIPILATAMKRGEFPSIDRKNRQQAVKDLQLARDKMLDGIALWVAPEGTRSADGQLARFKLGGFHVAMQAGALIVPLVIRNAHKIQPGKKLVLYLNRKIKVEICPAINTENYSPEQVKELAKDVRNQMLSRLDQVTGNGSQDGAARLVETWPKK